MQAMIFAAGKGTRLKPLTDIIPKALVPVADKPLIQRVMERLAEAGTERVVVNVHHHARQIENFLKLAKGSFPLSLSLSDETEQLLETGGGLKKAQMLFRNNEPVLIHNVDILSNINLAEFYQKAEKEFQKEGVCATLLVSKRKTQRYLAFDGEMRLVGWTNIATGEVKSPNPNLDISRCQLYAFSGIHCFSPSLFPMMDEWEERFPIMDFYLQNCGKVKIKGVVKDDLQLLDVGKLDTLSEAEHFLDALTF